MALAADLLRQRRTDPILQIDRTNGAFIPTARKQNAYEVSQKPDHKNLVSFGNKFLSVVFLLVSYIDLAHRNAFFIR